jgi:hypothetical protein
VLTVTSKLIHDACLLLPLALLCSAINAAPAAGTSATQAQRVSLGERCNFEVLDSFSGTVEKIGREVARYETTQLPRLSSLSRLSLEWRCIDFDDEQVSFAAVFNKKKRKWEADPERLIDQTETVRMKKVLRHLIHQRYSVLQLNTKTWDGYITIDRSQVNGSDSNARASKRAQKSGPIQLNFCAIKPPKALCGGGVVGRKEDGPDGDLTEMAVQLVRGILFVE